MNVDNVDASGGYPKSFTKVVVGYADLSVAAHTKTITLLSAAQRSLIGSVVVRVTTTFVAVGLTDLTASIGDANGSDVDSILADTDIKTAGIKAIGTGLVAAVLDFDADNNITMTFSANVNLSLLSAGSLTVYIEKSKLVSPA